MHYCKVKKIKPLYYGRIGLLNGNIYLRPEINVILAKGYITVAMRRKPDAMRLTKCKEISY